MRFWETRFAQIKPMQRAGGRRYYRPGDIDLLRGIRVLLYGEGYTIRGVQRILREGGTARVVAIGRGAAAAGAPPPEEAEEDDQVLTPPPPTRSAKKQPPPPPEPAPSLSKEQVDQLRLALQDLTAAKRLLGKE